MSRKLIFHEKLNSSIAVIAALILVFSFALLTSAYTQEVPEKVFRGIDNAQTMLNNIDYNDVRLSRAWSKEAICEVSALDIMKGYGSKTFGRTDPVTKEQALTLIYRSIGREPDAQRAAEALDRMRALEEKKTYAPVMWSDGYLQLAANDGLISFQDLNDAFVLDKTELTETSFYRDSPAQRQEIAFWMAKALGLVPVYGQQKIFNSYNDWTDADPHKVPYIEAVLDNSIMTGLGNGYFNPTSHVTREQMAQIIKNAADVILPLLGYEKEIGTIESIEPSKDFSDGQNIARNTFNVRNSNGKLHQIITEVSNNQFEGDRNEQNGSPKRKDDIDLIVFNGWIGKSSTLKSGDRIEYITTIDDRVTYVKVISNTADTKYIVAKINSIDTQNLTLNISKIFDLNYPDIDVESRNFSFDSSGRDVNITYVYSNNAEVIIDGKKSDITAVKPGMDVVLAVYDNIVAGIKTVTLRLKEQGVANGIVEDVNPQLGYITLYSERPEGSSEESEGLSPLKTYNYSNPKDIKVIKNYKTASIEDIEGGDSVYIKFDDDGNIELISAVDNYIEKHGKVLSKRPSTLAVQYDDGTQQILMTDEKVPVVLDKKIVDYNTLKDGDRVKLLLNITDRFTNLKQITIEGDEHFITNIYKGVVVTLDEISNSLILQNLEILQNGTWIRADQKGFTSIGLAENTNMFYNSESIDEDIVNDRLKNSDVYIAVENDYGGDEKAVVVSFKNTTNSEVPVFDDSIATSTSGSKGEILLGKVADNILYDEGTIIVKDKRLVTGNSISPEDLAYVIANRGYSDGKYYASVVEINQRPDMNFISIYRGRIAGIDENKDFTVNSYSQLNGVNWDYFNTPKTFRITYDTKIVDDIGIVGQRNFTDYGDLSYKDRTVYILANGTDTVLVNTAPYGDIFAKGEIFEITGTSSGEEGEAEEPTGFRLLNAKIYDSTAFMWKNSKDMTLNILSNSIILKENKIAKPSDLRKGDKVRVIKKDDSEAGDAYIIFVE